MAMPRTIARVVWTLWLTIDTLVPTSRLTSVDLPALGAPISATKPARVVGCLQAVVAIGLPHALADQRGGRGVLLGLAPRAAGAAARRAGRSTFTSTSKRGA